MEKRNKSAAIRKVIEATPAASVKEIQTALAAKRMKVSVALIHQVKGKGVAKSPNGKAPSFDQLLAAKAFVAKFANVGAAKAALDSYAKLV